MKKPWEPSMMSRLMSAEERYERDPMFKAVVDSLEAAIHNLHLTPTEIREAAMLASLRYERRRPVSFLVDEDGRIT